MSTGKKSFKTFAAAAVAEILVFGSAVAQAADDEPRWRYAIAPYIWGTNIDGTVGTNQREVDVSADFSDIVEFVDVAGSLRFEAIKRWGFFGDIFFASLSNDEDTPIGKVEVSFDQMIAEAGALYAFRPDVTGYFGARHQDLDGEIAIPVIGTRGADRNWTDAIVGVRYTPAFGNNWEGVLRADVGAGDSDLTWLAQVGLSYRFNQSWSAQLAYRYLYTDLDKDDFRWDVALDGFGVGLAYRFE